MRVAILGAGALGCLFGGFLAADGNDVWLLHHRRSRVRRLRDTGLRIRRPDGRERRVPVRATTDADRIGPVDLGLVLVNAHQTEAALRQHAGCIGPETRLLTLQNGLRNYEYLRSAVGPDRALGGVTYQGAILESPDVVTHSSLGETVVGGPDRGFAEAVRECFVSAGCETRVVDDPRATIWDKQLLGIATLPVSALTGLTVDRFMTDEALVRLMDRLVDEATRVAEARGVGPLTDDVLGKFRDRVGTYPEHRTSMLQAVERRRKTEIDEINGAVVDFATAEGVPVPDNRAMTALVRGLERSYLDDPGTGAADYTRGDDGTDR